MTALEFPLQIGLIGAPGSKKQELAEQFAAISTDWFAENNSEFRILPNTGNVIEAEADVAMGLLGGWSDDLRAYFKRFEQEEQARKDGVSWITLGTALDNIAHCGINLENIMTGIQTPDQQEKIQRYQVTMTTLTFLFLERFRYLFGFYLPYEGTSIVLPGQPEPSTYNPRIDQALHAIFSNFGLRIQILDQPTIEEKAAAMFETIQRIMVNGPELPPPPPVEEPESLEDPGVDIDDELGDLDDETKEKLAKLGVEFPDWQPTIPGREESPQSEPVTLAE